MKFTKFIVPAVALGLFSTLPSLRVRAGDTPATTQAVGSGSVTIKVVDADGSPVVGAKVQLVQPHKKGDAESGEKRSGPLAEGTTDAQGSVTLSGIVAGSYRAVAILKGSGRGAAKVTVGDEPGAPVTITLKGKHPKATADAPTTQQAQ